MDPILLALMIVGALTVLLVVVALAVSAAIGFRSRPVQVMLRIAMGGGILCGLLGVAFAFLGT